MQHVNRVQWKPRGVKDWFVGKYIYVIGKENIHHEKSYSQSVEIIRV